MHSARLLAVLAAASLVMPGVLGAEDGAPRFERDVAPVLARRCVKCHGRWEREAELDVRSVELLLRGGVSGPAVVPGTAQESVLYGRLREGTMPPSDEPRLTEQELEAIRGWIDAGAAAEDPRRLIGAGLFHRWGGWLAGLAIFQLALVGMLYVQGCERGGTLMLAAAVPLAAVAVSGFWWHPPDEHVWLAGGLLVVGSALGGGAVARHRGRAASAGAVSGFLLGAVGVAIVALVPRGSRSVARLSEP